MKVICEKDELLKGSQIVQTVVSPRSTLPILSNFLFEAFDKKIKFSSTDLEVGVSCFIKGEVVKEGNITIPAKRFNDIIRELPQNQEIEIKADEGNQISIRCGKSHFVLMGLPKADYPVLPDFPEDKTFVLDKYLLKSMLKKTSFAVSNDETRYVLNGVYFLAEKGSIKVVATDGRRLAYINKDGIDKKIEYKSIVPVKAINEVQRVISSDESSNDIKIGMSENQIAFQISGVSILSRLIEGTFPNYEQVIPKRHEFEAIINVKELLSAVRQMSLVTSDKVSAVRFNFTKNTLRIFASSQGFGSGEVELEIDYSGQEMEIAFNPNFMIDILKNIEESEVVIELTNPLNPALIKTKNDKDYLCVVMPMRV